MRIISGRWEMKFPQYISIAAGFVLALSGIGFLTYFIALDRVTLEVDGERQQWRTLSPTVGQVLEEKGIVLNPGDVVIPAAETTVGEDLRIQVIRSFPVKISVAGRTEEFFTVSRTVREVLEAAKVTFDDDDRIRPDRDAVVEPDQTIRVINVTSKVETKQVVVRPATEYRKDKALERGVQKVLREGQSGLVERKTKVFYEDGRPTRYQRLAEKVIKPSVSAIIALGIKPVIRTLETSRGSYRYVELKNMVATAYYPGPESCGVYAKYGRTYTGKKAGFGLVAVDPRVIPLGTQLYIEGYGKAEAADIGSAIKGNRIDLCYETYREALMYGKKKVKVYILE
jgi:uncharacterized protein YabE (DUF348 family)